jgi:hypothetical protein
MSTHYLPLGHDGVSLIASCAGCRREVVAMPSNTFGDKPMCRACRRDAERQTADDELGMAWWNGLTKRRRAYWLQRAGSCRPVDAWHCFKRAAVSQAA